MKLLIISCILLLLWLARLAFSFYVNRQQAQRIGLPIIISPIEPSNPAWILGQKIVMPLLRRLPFRLGKWVKVCYRGSQYDNKYAIHAELGDAWTLVTPSGNSVFLADSDAVEYVLRNRNSFPKPTRIYQLFEIFGPNLLTSEGDTFKRHRKVCGAFPFSERRMASVWREALCQASQLQEYWLSNKHRALSSTVEDATVLTMHVLTFAAFNIAYPFRRGNDISAKDMDFRDAFSFLLCNSLIIAGVPRQILEMPFIPLSWAKVGQAIHTVKAYIQVLIEQEKALYIGGSIGGHNLVSDLVRDSWDSKQATTFPKKRYSLSTTLPRMSLTEAEIFSNVFMFMAAGHDTVTQTLSYSILYLATYPEWQRWIAEEIQAITLDNADIEKWDYEALFPRFKRCKAIMFEILRLAPIIAAIPKYTAERDQNITAAGKTFTIPRRTLVFPNMMALHTHPTYWGADATSFRPSRWVTTDAEDKHPESVGCPTVSSLARESLLVPPRGFYFPWSDGPRACPGKKLAQVEVTAVLAYLFRDHFVEMVLRPNETFAAAQQRFAAKLHEYRLMFSLKIRDPKNMVVRWVQQ